MAAQRTVKIPGPDHPITITPSTAHIVITVGGQTIVDTHKALTLQEASYPPVHYIPRADVRLDLLERTQHQTWCPYKGECSYYSITPGATKSVNAIWTYETPHAPVAQIEGYMAFYPDRVDAISVN